MYLLALDPLPGPGDLRAEVRCDDVDSNARSQVLRAKVPGGWFVQIRDEVGHLKSEPAPLGAAFFYPDPEHKWDGSSLPR